MARQVQSFYLKCFFFWNGFESPYFCVTDNDVADLNIMQETCAKEFFSPFAFSFVGYEFDVFVLTASPYRAILRICTFGMEEIA